MSFSVTEIAGFFDAIDHAWLIRFLEHRIGDKLILRLIRKWLRAGISEEGEWSQFALNVACCKSRPTNPDR